MTDKPKRPRDANQLAKLIAHLATGEATEDEAEEFAKPLRDAGSQGGLSRAKSLTEKERSTLASRAAKVRWAREKKSSD